MQTLLTFETVTAMTIQPTFCQIIHPCPTYQLHRRFTLRRKHDSGIPKELFRVMPEIPGNVVIPCTPPPPSKTRHT